MGDTGESATVSGVFRNEAGAPMPNALVEVFLAHSEYNPAAARALTTNGAGQFQTTFSFDLPTLPVRVDRSGPGRNLEAAWRRSTTLTAPCASGRDNPRPACTASWLRGSMSPRSSASRQPRSHGTPWSAATPAAAYARMTRSAARSTSTDPCAESCILTESPVRLVRMP